MSNKNGQRGKNRFARKKKDNTLARTKKDSNQDKRLQNIEKRVKQVEGDTELKYFDVLNNSPGTTTGLLTLLNGMAAGTSQITRIGGQIKMTSLQWRYQLENIDTTLGPTYYRFLIVVDRQANGAVPTIPGNGVSGTPGILESSVINLTEAPYQYESIHRFKILHDERGIINPQQDLTTVAGTVTVNQTVAKVVSGYIKLNKTVKYDATGAGTATINMNALWSLFITDVNNGLIITGGSRLYFKDA